MESPNIPQAHHVKQEVCTSRPAYREGRKLTAVKVYTVHQESKYLLVQNVPAVGAKDQLEKLLSAYGVIEDLHPLDEYPADKFTEVYLVKFQKIQSARFAKKKLDDHSFFGGSLHICYAPEHETVKETREKLQDRRKVIASKVRKLEKESQSGNSVQTAAQTPAAVDVSRSSEQMPHTFSPNPPSFHPPPLPPPPPSLPPVPPDTSVPPPNFFPTQGPASLPQRSKVFQSGYTPSPVTQYEHGDSAPTPAPSLEEMTFQIPPPPMPGVTFDASQYKTPHFTKRDYGFAWVPSANSSFPPGYDPRLPQGDREGEGHRELDSGIQGVEERDSSPLSVRNNIAVDNDRLQLVSSTSNSSSHEALTRVALSNSGESTPKCSPANICGSNKVVVKQYKPKGPPPKFVPRQIKEKNDAKPERTVVSSKPSTAKEKEEEVNREIRREAFRLAEDQGPSLPSDPEMREQLLGQRPLVEPKVEASVVASVKAIRKRMSQFISETVPKQLKLSAETQRAKASHTNSSPQTDV